jgi:hypothetical protein
MRALLTAGMICLGASVARAGTMALLGAGSVVAAGGGGGGTTTYDPAKENASMTLSGGNLIATANSTSPVAQVETINGAPSGKYYFEVTYAYATGSHVFVGICASTYNVTSGIGIDQSGSNCTHADLFGVYSNAVYKGDITNASPANGTTYTLGIAVDQTNKKFYARRITGGVASRGWNNNGGDPVAGTGGFDYTTGSTATEYPAVQVDVTSLPLTINTGGSAYALAAPTGYGNL